MCRIISLWNWKESSMHLPFSSGAFSRTLQMVGTVGWSPQCATLVFIVAASLSGTAVHHSSTVSPYQEATTSESVMSSRRAPMILPYLDIFVDGIVRHLPTMADLSMEGALAGYPPSSWRTPTPYYRQAWMLPSQLGRSGHMRRPWSRVRLPHRKLSSLLPLVRRSCRMR